MKKELKKIKNFTDLNVWKEAHKLVLTVYKITKKFPKDEQFGLINQLRRAVVSITSNISEGFSRYSYKEKSQFYFMALGSLTEVQNQLIIAKDLKYITSNEYYQLEELTVVVSKLLNGLIKVSKTKIHDS
ncbi:MAG TPA: four helix bundle protein [Patescibacteria group bacterium]|nr:four helix bundle protein [Patescibacteria group bacterium]